MNKCTICLFLFLSMHLLTVFIRLCFQDINFPLLVFRKHCSTFQFTPFHLHLWWFKCMCLVFIVERQLCLLMLRVHPENCYLLLQHVVRGPDVSSQVIGTTLQSHKLILVNALWTFLFSSYFRYEMLAQCQRDLTQEQAAEKLRNVPDIHYKQENEWKY